MSQPVNETGAYDPQPTPTTTPSLDSTGRAAVDQFDRARAWTDERRGLSLGAAALLMGAASVATAIAVRRRQEARMDRLAWLTMRTRAVGVPPLRQTAPLGGAGGALLMTALLVARARRAQAHHSRLDELSERLAMLQAQANAHLPSDRPNPRDLLLGGAVGMALAGLVGRMVSHRAT